MYATHFHQPQTQVDQQGLLPAFMESFGNLTLGDANEQGPVSSTVRAAVQVIPTPTGTYLLRFTFLLLPQRC